MGFVELGDGGFEVRDSFFPADGLGAIDGAGDDGAGDDGARGEGYCCELDLVGRGLALEPGGHGFWRFFLMFGVARIVTICWPGAAFRVTRVSYGKCCMLQGKTC